MAKAEIAAEASLETTKFQRGLAKADKGVKKFAKSSIASVGRIAGAFAGVSLVKSVLGLGTAAAETASKFEAVFGPAAAQMNEQIEELKKTIPATTMEMQNALATFGQMARSFGLNEDAANMFSVQMVKMAGDLASFHNMRPEDVFLKLRAAISGEFEPLKQLGIVINETTLKQEALNKGIWDGNGAMSAAQKALTTQSLLVQQMGTAQGDAAATADSAANKIKFLQTKLKDMGTEIGQTVLPAVVQMVEWLGKAADIAKTASEAVGKMAGEVIYGPQTEGFEALAEEKLIKEGKLKPQTFKGGLPLALERKKLIEKEAKALKEKHELELKAQKEAEKQKKVEEDVTKETTDPKRVEAQKEYTKAVEKTIDAAGELKSVQKTTKTEGDKKKKELDEKVKKIKLAILRAEARGDERAEKSLKNRLKLAERILQIMNQTGATQQEATNLANAEGRRSGQTLGQAMADAKKQGIRFQRMRGPGGKEMFQRFENGRKTGGLMTKEALEKAAARRPQQKDPAQLAEQSNKYLESIDREIRRNP